MRLNKVLRITGWGALALFLAIQLMPVERSNPPVEADLVAPKEVEAVLRTACYDCHSSETRWPWYSYVAPVSWIIADDVKKARREMTFSEWGVLGPREQLELRQEVWEEIEKGKMPLKKYVILHPSARLDEEQKRLLRDWCQEAN